MAERKEKKSLKARATEALQGVLQDVKQNVEDAVEALQSLMPAPTPTLVPVPVRSRPARRYR
jgi:hypothetical protein